MLIVGGAGILACTTASCRNLLIILLQCRGQECPQLLQFALPIMHNSAAFADAYQTKRARIPIGTSLPFIWYELASHLKRAFLSVGTNYGNSSNRFLGFLLFKSARCLPISFQT